MILSILSSFINEYILVKHAYAMVYRSAIRTKYETNIKGIYLDNSVIVFKNPDL